MSSQLANTWAHGPRQRPWVRRVFDRLPPLLLLAGASILAVPHIREAAGQWAQFREAAAQDREILAYRNALAGTYEVIFDPFEDVVVAFRSGALPEVDHVRSDASPATIPELPTPVTTSTGWAHTRIRIPGISLDQAVVEGVSTEALQRGPGHYPGTALPGQPGNIVISGHRTTYTRPFYSLDRLKPGDRVYLDTPARTYVYLVERVFVVALSNVRPLEGTAYPRLTLTTCDPPGSATQRLVVQARLYDGTL